MSNLPDVLFSTFENEILTARDVAEKAAKAATTTLAVEQDRPFDAMNETQRELRRILRARARQLGGGEQEQGMPRLVEEIAYEQWHRLLFSRFLTENDLLMHPDWGVPVSLEECDELAPEEGAKDRWELAARYAVAMLPGIFNFQDPALQVRFAPEWQQRLEQLVDELPKVVFTADDSLGWAYQFWQSKKKDEVNASERKIGGADIAPVTQLFTEDYMVKFLLHNSLGAWWATRHPDSPLLESYNYLRYRDDGTPAAGTFDGWPKRASEVTVMDPCCGSGHFLVAAFEILTQMRMEEEGLRKAEAGDAVIQDNLFGLEIDPRCTQIAAFNLALTAWKAGGYHKLPLPNIACSGIPVQGQLEDWVRLAGKDEALKRSMERLYHLFRNAPDLGSLINPAYIPVEERMFVGDFEQVEPLLERALQQEIDEIDPPSLLYGKTVKGVAMAARLLTDRYTLVVTNVPYAARGKLDQFLLDFCEERYPESKSDLATVFIERCRTFTKPRACFSLVTPQNWLFLYSYQDLRIKLLKEQSWRFVARLGEGGFASNAAAGAFSALLIFTNETPLEKVSMICIDASDYKQPDKKANSLRFSRLSSVTQMSQLNNPDSRVTLVEIERSILLSQYADSFQGLSSGDYPRFGRYFWEKPVIDDGWKWYQGTVKETTPYGGRERVIWLKELKRVAQELGSAIRGKEAWGKSGIAVSQMRHLPVSLYSGDLYDNNMAALIPKEEKHLKAIWAFCQSPNFHDSIRQIDQKIYVQNATIVKVPFDLEYWQTVADDHYPDGLPEPYSCDPTQWLFEGYPVGSTAPLQVAIAQLVGYQWPRQMNYTLKSLADQDGILCLPAVAGEMTAAERLRALLNKAFGNAWSLTIQHKLMADVSFEGRDLVDWLRNGFFKQHCQLFKNRPFIWHIWDGRKDGFNVLVNYHKLDHARLEKLIYTYLGDWIRTQKDEQEQGIAGSEGRLVAAIELKEKLELILEGEPPFDIFVRWKGLHEQPIGWNPDLNDGVRINIRPFVKAGVLRSKFTINWGTDRGKNPDGSRRRNDLHFTRAEKEAARTEIS